ncbi:hypothetical protein FQZ97_1057160 [compost metagenome]
MQAAKAVARLVRAGANRRLVGQVHTYRLCLAPQRADLRHHFLGFVTPGTVGEHDIRTRTRQLQADLRTYAATPACHKRRTGGKGRVRCRIIHELLLRSLCFAGPPSRPFESDTVPHAYSPTEVAPRMHASG